MDIRPIRNEADYEAALAQIARLMDAATIETQAGDQLDVLVTLVEAYEAKHHPIPAPDPIAAVQHALDAQGLEDSDLPSLIGVRHTQAREILDRRRPLTLPMVRQLHERLRIPAEVLIQHYPIENSDHNPR